MRHGVNEQDIVSNIDLLGDPKASRKAPSTPRPWSRSAELTAKSGLLQLCEATP